MRRVLLGDLMAAVHCVAAAPIAAQSAVAARLIARADAAHRYSKRFGRAHPHWGFGNLQAIALTHKDSNVPDMDLGDARTLLALRAVAAALLARKAASLPRTLPCPKYTPCDTMAQSKGTHHGRSKSKTLRD